jgi:tetratricopeptide (TPR) repeat protein
MLVHEGPRPGSYRFSHQLVHDAVCASIRAMRRARLHLEVGEALERLRARGRLCEPATLAYHFIAARGVAPDSERAVGYVLDAARRCIETFAYDEAIEQAEVALELDSSDAARCRVLLIQGAALQRRGDATEAHAAFQEAASLARSLATGVEFADAALGLVVGGRGVSTWITDDIRRSLLKEALDRLGPEQPILRIRLLGAAAEALYGPEHWDRRHTLAEEAVELARSLGDAASLGAALEANRVALWGPGNTVRRLEATNAVMELAVRLDDDALKLRACIGRLYDLVELSDREDVDTELARGHDLAAELRQPKFSWELALMDAMLAYAEGRRTDAERLAGAAEEIWGVDEAPDAHRARLEQVALMAFAMGEIDIAAADSVGDVVAQHPELGAYVCAYPFVLASVGRNDEAQRRLDAIAVNDYADVPQHSSWMFAVALLSEAAAKVGSQERATELMQLLAPYAGRLVFLEGPHMLWGSVDHQLGILSIVLGRTDEAIACLESAVEIEERFGSPSFAERSRLELNRIRGLASAPT